MNRIIPGILLAFFWLLLLLQGSVLLFSICAVIISLVGAYEYLRMVVPATLAKMDRVYLLATISLPVIATAFAPNGHFLLPSIVVTFFLLTGYFLYRYASLEESYPFFAKLVFGSIYIGLFLAHLILLRNLPDGQLWLVIASAITSCSDSGAYFVGCSVGKTKLCPHISPKKTIEGALGGLVFGLVAAFAGAYLLLPYVNPVFLGVVAFFLVLAGIVGDLTESIIKRGTGTKDSGTILGGHGGILDRIDSLLFAGPLLYTILVFAS